MLNQVLLSNVPKNLPGTERAKELVKESAVTSVVQWLCEHKCFFIQVGQFTYMIIVLSACVITILGVLELAMGFTKSGKKHVAYPIIIVIFGGIIYKCLGV